MLEIIHIGVAIIIVMLVILADRIRALGKSTAQQLDRIERQNQMIMDEVDDAD